MYFLELEEQLLLKNAVVKVLQYEDRKQNLLLSKLLFKSSVLQHKTFAPSKNKLFYQRNM